MNKLIFSWLRSFATAAVIVGPLSGLFALGFAIYTANFISHAIHTTGTVTNITGITDENKNATYTPTFVFKTQSGQMISTQSNVSSNPPDFALGQQVSVLFDPNDPAHAEINTTVQLWLVPIICGTLSILFTPVGIILLRKPRIRTAPLYFWTRFNNV